MGEGEQGNKEGEGEGSRGPNMQGASVSEVVWAAWEHYIVEEYTSYDHI